MNYEKAYKEALERAREIIEYYKEHHRFDEASIEDLEHIFPGLAESEDERIKKDLIGFFKDEEFLYHKKEEIVEWLEKQGEIDGSIKWHSVFEEPEEMRELLCEWDSDDSTWHEVAFYHSDNKTFWNGERQVENVTKWCYIDELFEKQGEKEKDGNEDHYLLCQDDNIKWSDTDKLLMRLDKIVDCNIDHMKCLNNIFDKLNEIIGKLDDIHEVLSKPYVFPYRDYTPPSGVPGMDVWYKTHGVEKVTPVTCETLNSIETDNGKDNDKERTN